jgi:threonine dehydratase
MSMKKPSKTELQEAHARISQRLKPTPVLRSHSLDQLVGAELHFKCENFQKTGSFKARGALNAILRLDEESRQKGVATHSSGNHGQALAWAAASAGIPCYVVMPENAPRVKVAAVKAYGAEVHFCAPNLAAREAGLAAIQQKTGALFIPPFDYYPVICGQSTCAAELIKQAGHIDALFCPVGGGGLLAGSALQLHYFAPQTELYAAEPSGADDAYRSFYGGKRVTSHQPNTIADGLLTTLGELNFPIIRELVKDIFLANESEIKAAFRLIYERLKIVIEPSCALPLAVLLAQKEAFQNKKIGIILSGGNLDLDQMPRYLA